MENKRCEFRTYLDPEVMRRLLYENWKRRAAGAEHTALGRILDDLVLKHLEPVPEGLNLDAPLPNGKEVTISFDLKSGESLESMEQRLREALDL